MKEEIYEISGMHCAACAASVEKVVSKLEGTELVQVNLMTAKMFIRYDEKLLDGEKIKAKVKKAGFEARLYNDSKKRQKSERGPRLSVIIVCAVIAVVITVLSILSKIAAANPDLSRMDSLLSDRKTCIAEAILCLAVYIFNYRIFLDGYKSLLKLHPDMNSLIALSASVSYLYSLYTVLQPVSDAAMSAMFESGVMVVAMISVGKYIEQRCKRRTGEALEKLTALAPETAFRVDPKTDSATEIPVEKLLLDDIIFVRAGQRVPVDGVVIRGTACADESMLTGESLPVDKHICDIISAGTILTDGSVYATVKAIGRDTKLSGIVRYVEEAQTKKAPIARIADKISLFFVPAVIAIALISGTLVFLTSENAGLSFGIFCNILSVACPCAMGLATPTAIMVGTGMAAQNGILIRSGEALEELSRIDTVVFDKTGTLTLGSPKVEKLECFYLNSPYDILKYAAALEAMSTHPLAVAICEMGKQKNVGKSEVTDFENVPGKGLRGRVDGREVLIGNIEFTEAPMYDDELGTNVYIKIDGKISGRFVLTDEIRPEASKVIEKLKADGKRVVLLSGDAERTVRAVAQKLNIDEYHSGIAPKDKAEILAAIKKEGRKILMVGDGINDAPALTVADLGMAVGGGTDIAIDSADVVMLREGIDDCPRALKLGRFTLRKIKQSLAWAFAYNTVTIILACGIVPGVVFPSWLGGILMSMSSILVVLNALSLKKSNLD